MRIFFLLVVFALMFLTSISMGSDVTIWFGRPDGSPLVFKVDSRESAPIWIQTNPDVYVAALHIPLASSDKYISKRLGGDFFKPFVNDNPPERFDKGWDCAYITKAVPHRDKQGYTSQGILGFSDLGRGPNISLHCEKQCLIAELYVQTAADDSLKGHTYDVFIEGFDNPSKGISLSDTLGVRTFRYEVYFSRVHFLYPGDINNDFKIDSSDYESLKLYLDGKLEIPWPIQRGDCNNDSKIDEQDLQHLEKYLNEIGEKTR